MILVLILLLFGVFLFLILMRKQKKETKARHVASTEIMARSKNNQLTVDRTIEKLYFVAAAWMMKKNASKVSKKRSFVVSYMHEYFEVEQVSAENYLDESFELTCSVRNLSGFCNEVLKHKDEKIQFFDFLFAIIFADDDIIDREFTAIIRLGELTGVPANYIEKKIFQFRVESSTDVNPHQFSIHSDKRKAMALTVLGLPFNATWDDVKKKYRKLVKELHPDKISSESVNLEEQNRIKFEELQEAYEDLVNWFKK
jgi:DnaJ like chaperone protein